MEKVDFPWNNGEYPEFTEPDPTYGGISYWELFGGKAEGEKGTAFTTMARVQLLRDLGPLPGSL